MGAWRLHSLRMRPAARMVPVPALPAFEVFVNDRNVAATSLFRSAGFEPVTYAAEMVRPSVDDLPHHPLPEGVEIRPVTEDQLRAIWEADAEAFRDHWGYVEPTEVAYEHFLAFPQNDPTLWKVAWDDEGVAGQVRSFIDTAQNEERVSCGAGPSSSRRHAAGGVAGWRRR
jgi:mycothiol synthase